MATDPIRQSLAFNQAHRLGETERLQYGFRDAGRRVRLGEDGALLDRPNREVMTVESPETDAAFGAALAAARAGTAGLATVLQRVDYLNDFVASLLAENDPTQNAARLAAIAGGELAGAEISLGRMIEARTGVCRHRSLLFKALADETGVPAALVRGNYSRRGADRPQGRSGGRGAHAWNEVVLESGERILVDVMHNLITEMQDTVVLDYADVGENRLYAEAAAKPKLAPPAALGDPDVAQARGAYWVQARSPIGGRSAYAYLDAMSTIQAAALGRALDRLGVRHDEHQTSLGAEGGKRQVLRVRAAAYVRLRQLGVDASRRAPPLPQAAEA